jgi:hypothetical protein
MIDPAKANPGPQSVAEFTINALRLAAAGYAFYFALGLLLFWMNLFRMRLDLRDGSALFFPWVYLPLFASAGLSAGFAIWGNRRSDLIGVCGQAVMAMQAVYGICEIALDVAVNRYGSYTVAGKFFTAALLGLVAASALRHALSGYAYPWLPMLRMILSEIPLLLAVVIGNGVIDGGITVWHDKLNGSAAFTTPVILVGVAIGAAATIALVRLAWRIQSRPLTQGAGRFFPAHWNV